MKEIKVKTKLDGQDSSLFYEGKGKYDDSKKSLKFHDQGAVVTIFLQDSILLRETEEAVLSYKFSKDKSFFEIFLKKERKTGRINLETRKIVVSDTFFEVVYHIDGNDFDHDYFVEWS